MAMSGAVAMPVREPPGRARQLRLLAPAFPPAARERHGRRWSSAAPGASLSSVISVALFSRSRWWGVTAGTCEKMIDMAAGWQWDLGSTTSPMAETPTPHVRVLLADDHVIVRDGLARLLDGSDGIEVVGSVGDGEQAVAATAELAPDVVLMDLAMPVLDGVEATRRITAQAPATRVVVLTSFSDNTRVLEALDAGARGYVLKDAEGAEVVRAVHAAARDEAPLDPRVARTLLMRQRNSGALSGMTAREREVLELIGAGMPNKLIARQLGISEATVKAHLTRIYRQIGVSDRTQAAMWARNHGLAPR